MGIFRRTSLKYPDLYNYCLYRKENEVILLTKIVMISRPWQKYIRNNLRTHVAIYLKALNCKCLNVYMLNKNLF